MIILREVFNNVYEWDTTWESFKTNNFWEINVSDMEMTVLRIYKQLNHSITILKDENWKILEMTLNKVDDLRRVLPLINDLKNPAMKPRHWDEVREVMKR